MCLFTVQHYSYHMVAVRMTMEPFTTDGTGDYSSPCILQEHECEVGIEDPPERDPSSESRYMPRPLDFGRCPWHGTCCITWEIEVGCKAQQREGPDFECPNVSRFHEYYPITEAMEPEDPDSGEQIEPCWVDPHPGFPVNLLFAKDKQGDDEFEDILDLREEFCEASYLLFESKKELAKTANDAWDQLTLVRQLLDVSGPVRITEKIGFEIGKGIELIEAAREQLNEVLRDARHAVVSYHDLQRALGNPEYTDQSANRAAFNPDSLEGGSESLKVVFDAFEGPLKMVPEMFEWCREMRRIQEENGV